MGFTVDSNGDVTMIGPGTGSVMGAINSSGFVNVTQITLGANGISGTFNFTGQIVISNGQASLTNGTYTTSYNWGGVAWQAPGGTSTSPPPIASGSGTWNVPAFTLPAATGSGVAKYAGTYLGNYLGTINSVIFSPSTFTNDPITLADNNTGPTAKLTLELRANNDGATIFVAPNSQGLAAPNGTNTDGTNDVTLTGTLAQLQAAVNGLVYYTGSVLGTTNYHVSDLLSITLTDSADTTPAVTNGALLASFQAPSLSPSSTSSVSVRTKDTLAFDSGPGDGPSISVNDDAKAIDQLTLSVSHGTLALAPGTLLPGYAGPASTITVTGTPAQLNAALADGNGDFLQYTPNVGYIGPDALQITLANESGDGLLDLPYAQQVTNSIGINITS